MSVSMGRVYIKIYTSLKVSARFFHLLINSKGKTQVIAQDVVTLCEYYAWLVEIMNNIKILES